MKEEITKLTYPKDIRKSKKLNHSKINNIQLITMKMMSILKKNNSKDINLQTLMEYLKQSKICIDYKRMIDVKNILEGLNLIKTIKNNK